MITIGLTGGIGSGKSTVSLMLKTAGFEIIDADIIARDVLKKYPEILEKVKIEFGAGFFDWRGDFRRKEFGNHIFRFPKQRKKYEEIHLRLSASGSHCRLHRTLARRWRNARVAGATQE